MLMNIKNIFFAINLRNKKSEYILKFSRSNGHFVGSLKKSFYLYFYKQFLQVVRDFLFRIKNFLFFLFGVFSIVFISLCFRFFFFLSILCLFLLHRFNNCSFLLLYCCGNNNNTYLHIKENTKNIKVLPFVMAYKTYVSCL